MAFGPICAATAPNVEPGGYYGPDKFKGMRGHPKRVGSNAKSRDEVMARKLWDLSEQLTGVSLPRP